MADVMLQPAVDERKVSFGKMKHCSSWFERFLQTLWCFATKTKAKTV